MIVVKVGTNVLSVADGSLDVPAIEHLVEQISSLLHRGERVILVSSGAVGAGRKVLGDLSSDLSLVERKQLLAAVGQPHLLQLYYRLFAKRGIHVAQILASKDDFRDRKHYLHMRDCFEAILRERVIPIVNENDVIAVEELMFTDNDELAALIAAMLNASSLYVLTNVDGVYQDEVVVGEGPEVIEEIDPEDPFHSHLDASKKSSFGRGGMMTKYRISRRLAHSGIDVYIANGKKRNTLINLYAGKRIGTHFLKSQKLSSVKKWITYQGSASKGRVEVNQGAVEALTDEKKAASLLPIGIVHINEPFDKGDLVTICDSDQRQIGIGIAQYSAKTLKKYLGRQGQRPLIHYDYLVLNHER